MFCIKPTKKLVTVLMCVPLHKKINFLSTMVLNIPSWKYSSSSKLQGILTYWFSFSLQQLSIWMYIVSGMLFSTILSRRRLWLGYFRVATASYQNNRGPLYHGLWIMTPIKCVISRYALAYAFIWRRSWGIINFIWSMQSMIKQTYLLGFDLAFWRWP